jgi:hypothetical protein
LTKRRHRLLALLTEHVEIEIPRSAALPSGSVSPFQAAAEQSSLVTAPGQAPAAGRGRAA